MLTEKSFDTDEITINYAESPALGSPLVLLHGATSWWRDLQPLIDKLSFSYHVYACDHRGHGKSSHAGAGQYHLSDYARDTAAFLKGGVADSAILVGHSLGALVALEVASQLPQYVRALVVLDPPLEIREIPIEQLPYFGWFSWVHQTITSSSSVSEIAEKCQAMMPTLDAAAATDMAKMYGTLDPKSVAATIDGTLIEGVDWTAVLQSIHCPTLLLWGEKDRDVPSALRPEDAEFLLANVAGSKAVQIKGTGHIVHWEKPDECVSHVKGFLGSLERT
jgi:pimeloyl-ACP methyl ester carboxylesterase